MGGSHSRARESENGAAVSSTTRGARTLSTDNYIPRRLNLPPQQATSLGYAEQPGGPRLREAIASVHYSTVGPGQINVLAPQVSSYTTIY